MKRFLRRTLLFISLLCILLSLSSGLVKAAEVTITLKTSPFGIINVAYSKDGQTIKHDTGKGDVLLTLEENTVVTLTVNKVKKGKKFKDFKGIEPTKIEVQTNNKFLVKASVTLEAEFIDIYSLTIKKNGGPELCPLVKVNNKEVSENYAELEKGDIITLNTLLGYTYVLNKYTGVEKQADGYKVNGNVVLELTFTKQEDRWVSIIFTQSLEPSGFLEINSPYQKDKLVSGDKVPMGLLLNCVVSKIPLGYNYSINLTGLTQKSEKTETDPLTALRKYEYTWEVTANAKVEVALSKKEEDWYTVTYADKGTDANGNEYKLLVYGIEPETGQALLIKSATTKIPKGMRFYCDFEVTPGAYPTVVCSNADALTADPHLSPFMYRITDNAELTVTAWQTKEVTMLIADRDETANKYPQPPTIVSPATLGELKVYYLQGENRIEVHNNDRLPWGTLCFIEATPKTGAELKEQKMKGLVLVKEKQYKLIADAEVEATFIRSSYTFTLHQYEGVDITAKVGTAPISLATKLHYDDEIQIVVQNNKPNEQWIKKISHPNLETVEGTPNTYKVKGDATILLEIVKLYALQLKGATEARYEVHYTSKGNATVQVVETADVTVYADENSEVLLKLIPKENFVLKEVQPAEAQPAANDPNQYSFTVTQPTDVSLRFEALLRINVVVACGEQGKLQLSYTEPSVLPASVTNVEVEGTKELSIEKGTTVKIKALPNTHYRVATFKVGDNEAFIDEGIFVVKDPVRIELSFEKKTYPVAAISYRGLGQLKLFTLGRTKNIDLKQGDLVEEGEKIQLSYEADKEFTPDVESLQVTGLEKEGNAYLVTGAVTVHIDFVPNANPSAVSESQFTKVDVMPNPFGGYLIIKNPELRTLRYTLSSVQGWVLRAASLTGKYEEILETTDLPAGFYLLSLTTDEGATKVYSVVKQ